MPTFSGEDTACVIKYYLEFEETLDSIGGFNPIFERLWLSFCVARRRLDVSKDDLWQYMTYLRKKGILPRKKGVPRKKRAVRTPVSAKEIQTEQKGLFDDQKADQGDVPGDRHRRQSRKAR